VLPAAAPPGLAFTVAERSAVAHAGAEGVLGGVAGAVVTEVDGTLDGVVAAVVAAGDAGLPAELLLLVDPQAAARAPVHSRAAAALILRVAWADDVMGRSLVVAGPRAVAPGVS
jgi:hypothetical protein